ncbi:mycothiol system anti-sigma-R factor [Acaricomes phytoseiuli]|uniref:mycothiol system anti-sigma-R factor n=1 Tax=Acaricomes phytoseiuli TaxID=291968 RepID=UPI00037FF993|nr:mycothiol system anti-sigma-R factor [Acaricomes phytoseiuli]MCW1249379.1 mycothiol system anti-sigma-R factor [Acaricomes phytoseiuli]
MSDCQSLGDCQDERVQRIYEYIDGALSPEDVAQIKAHLDNCPDCAGEYDLECLIRAVIKRSCAEVAPEKLKSSILERIHAMKTVEA